MPIYLVEGYLPQGGRGLADACARARSAGSRAEVRHVRSTFIPSDELCQHVFEAASLDSLRDAIEEAAVRHDRIVEAVEP